MREAPDEAFGLVLAARVPGFESIYPLRRLESLLGRVPQPHELRDLDHYLNAFEAVPAGSRQDLTMTMAIVAGYSALKWVDQHGPGTNLLYFISGGRWTARAPGVSRATWDEVRAGWHGAWDGYAR